MSTAASSRVLSPASVSSYDYVSARSNSGFTSQSESYGVLSDGSMSDLDEIVWSVSDLSSLSISGALSQRPHGTRSPATFSEEEYIVLSRARSPARSNAAGSSNSLPRDITRSIERELAAAIEALSLTPSPPRAAAAPAGPTRFDIRHAVSVPAGPTPRSAGSPQKSKPKKSAAPHAVGAAERASKKAAQNERRRERKAAKKAKQMAQQASGSAGPAPASPQTPKAGLGERNIVDDVSEAGDPTVDAVTYHDAVAYVSSVLSNPAGKSGNSNLKLLQALIIELGLCPSALLPSPSNSAPFPSLPSLPHSLRAARALLKSHVFLNVRDYLTVRGQGLEALRRVMHPSRGSLMREVRSGRRMSLKAIKDAGLNVLLVACF